MKQFFDPDPGKRVKIISDNQRNYLIHIGPHQPELPHFPINQSISKTKQSKFFPKWYKEYPHLEYSIEKDAAFCFVCCLFSEGVGREKSDPAWTITGVNRWDKMKSVEKSKLGKLAQHFSSSSHKSALSDYSHFRSSLRGHVDVLLSKQKRSDLVQQEYDNSFNHQILSILFDVARTLGRQGLAFRGDGKEEDGNFKQIVYLLSRHYYVMKKWLDSEKFRPYHVTYLSATSQNEMIYLLGAEVKKAVAEEVKKAEMFSIMADTTPDTSHKDILSINVRIVNREGLAKERLLQVLAIQDKTGAGLANEIPKSLSENLLDIDNVAFQSYDFTSSMSGQYNGTQKKFSDLAGRSVPYIPCQAHRINTFIEHACSASLVISEMFNILEAVYTFFSGSTKRYGPLLQKLSELENALQLRNLSRTRWTARAESIKAVSFSLEIILNTLDEMASSGKFDSKTKLQAFTLRKKLLSLDFITSSLFMKNVMYKLKKLTEVMESPELNIVDAMSLIRSTVLSLETINADKDGMNDLIEGSVVFSKSLGLDPEGEFRRCHRTRFLPKRYDENSENQVELSLKTFYRQQYSLLLDTLISMMKENLEVCLATIEPLYLVLQPPLKRFHITETSVGKFVSLFPPGIASLDPLALQAELEILADNCPDNKNFSEIMKKSEEIVRMIPLANRACRLLYTSPVTVASNERTFSKMKIVKNVLRNSMGNARLDCLMMLACEKDLVDSISLGNILKKWSHLKRRRVVLKFSSLE